MLTGHPHITNFEARIHNSKIEKKKIKLIFMLNNILE